MPALLDSPPQQQLPATSGWGSLYPVEEQSVKPRHLLPFPAAAAAAKRPAAYGVRRRNMETCTEALGCETGGVDVCDGGVEAECAERKRRSREEEEETVEEATKACRVRGPLPPPLTTLARGASRVRMVHERRDGRLEMFAVRSPGVLDAERSGGRLRLRLLPFLFDAGNDAAAYRRQEPEAEEEAKETEDEVCGFAKYVHVGRRCVDLEGGAAAAVAMRGKQWEPEQAAAFWVATS